MAWELCLEETDLSLMHTEAEKHVKHWLRFPVFLAF